MNTENNSEFKIFAKTYCLNSNHSNSEVDNEIGSLLSENQKYNIPIFQRPYSWGEKNVEKFIKDIINSYSSTEGELMEEPLFIGTMQVSKPNKNTYDVIDGQQRLTTLLLLFSTLNRIYKDTENYREIDTDWLTTNVSSGEQQKSLSNALKTQIEKLEELHNNLYATNILTIKDLLDELIGDEQYDFDVNGFVEYLMNSIYFVVIETHAGLSQTLQIFDTINTTGLDLNGGDIFKIRMYEYLTRFKNADKNIFENISALYNKIESNNKEHKTKISVNHILKIYQYRLIARNDLPKALYKLGTTKFYERLFDTLFKINEWNNFNKAESVELKLDDIDQIIEDRYAWHQRKFTNTELSASLNLMWYTRYGRYWILIFIFYSNFKKEENFDERLDEFIIKLTKLYFIYSIKYKRVVNEIHSFTYDLISTMEKDQNLTKTINAINNKISENHNSEDLNKKLTDNVVENQKRKGLILRLVAILDENINETDPDKINEITNKIFRSKVDVEHIQPFQDKDKESRSKIREDWKEEMHGLGNLILLERKINRSVSNKPYEIKKNQYAKSKFSSVARLIDNHDDWNIAKAESRREQLKNNIVNYIFNLR